MTEPTPSYTDADLLDRVTEIVSAYVSNNAVASGDLAHLISETYGALRSLSSSPPQPKAEALTPAVSIRKSITPDFLVCLDDGKKFKSLKQHIGKLGMTPEQYRAKWGLSADYPMVAPNYSATRSSLAIANGLGRNPAPMAVGSVKRTRKPKVEA